MAKIKLDAMDLMLDDTIKDMEEYTSAVEEMKAENSVILGQYMKMGISRVTVKYDMTYDVFLKLADKKDRHRKKYRVMEDLRELIDELTKEEFDKSMYAMYSEVNRGY